MAHFDQNPAAPGRAPDAVRYRLAQHPPTEPHSPGPDLQVWPVAAILDAIPDATAVLDRRGRIVAVNRAWRAFAVDDHGHLAGIGVGVDYLGVCARAASTGRRAAAQVTAGLRAALRGESVEADVEVVVPSVRGDQWYLLRISPIDGPTPGVLVSHVNISRQKAAEITMRRRAGQDLLTGLANRAVLVEHLTLALAARPQRAACRGDVALLYLDLDAFKPVNDTYGHAAGDAVLRTVAMRLSQHTRPLDTVARLGGDEFGVLAPRIDADGLARLADRLEHAVRQPIPIQGRRVLLGASVGAVLAAPGEDAEAVLARADAAMYAVKATRHARPVAVRTHTPVAGTALRPRRPRGRRPTLVTLT